MNEEETKIARAFVACGRWRWMPGMMSEGWRLTCVSLHDGAWSATSTLAHREYHHPTLPDTNDPGTLGCILRLVRDAGGMTHKLSILPMGCHLVVEWPDGRIDSFRGTFAGVLLHALQAAPEVTDG